MLTRIFSEILPASTCPAPSRNGLGFPGLHLQSRPTRASAELNRVTTPVHATRLTFRARVRPAGFPFDGGSFMMLHPVIDQTATIRRGEEVVHGILLQGGASSWNRPCGQGRLTRAPQDQTALPPGVNSNGVADSGVVSGCRFHRRLMPQGGEWSAWVAAAVAQRGVSNLPAVDRRALAWLDAEQPAGHGGATQHPGPGGADRQGQQQQDR
jgi:hypothetical protein